MESSVKPRADSLLLEGIAMLLSRWNGLQTAIQNQWGGHDSLLKSKQLASEILSWFSQSKEQPYVEDLENLLHESLLLSFNTDIEDGSIEEFYGDETWKLGGKCNDVLKSKVSGTRQGGRAAGTSGFNTVMRLSSKEYSPQVGKTEAQI